MKYRVDKHEALRYLGYSGQRFEGDFLERFDAIVAACEQRLHPSFVFEIFDIDAVRCDDAGGPCIVVKGTNLIFSGTDIYEHLHQARQCALIAATLGMESERELRRYSAQSPFDALVYGAACSALVEQVTDEAEAQVVGLAAQKNFFTGTRYSPGYGNFSLDIQPKFLTCLKAQQRMGLVATERNFLVPTKSVTAVIGLFEQPPVVQKSSCTTCTMKDECSIRASGRTCYES